LHPSLDARTIARFPPQTEESNAMTRIAIAIAVALAAIALPAAAGAPQTEDEKTAYAIGLSLAQQLSSLSLTPAEAEWVGQGLKDMLAGGKPAVDLQTYGPKVRALAQTRRQEANDKATAVGKEFAEKAAQEPGAVKTDSGLVYLSLQDGSGASPMPSDKVKVNYRGTLIDGREFDSSAKHGGPTEFRLDQVVKCWSEGVQKMKAGGKAKLVCPPAIAYGERGAGAAIPPNATLVFEVELLGIGNE
jgi:FKBP-type peptidyl-prolyl cis-trans isomerase FkpA